MTAPDGWIDEPRDRYCCPPACIEFALDVYPDGIDRDLFWDPLTQLPARDRYSIRHGDDTLQLDPYAPCRVTGAPVCRLHGNGPYSKTNPACAPSKWLPYLVRHWTARSLLDPRCELLTVSPLAPSSGYWRRAVWPHALVVLSGRINFEVDGKPTRGARHDIAQCFYTRNPDRREAVRAAAYRRGWGVAEWQDVA